MILDPTSANRIFDGQGEESCTYDDEAAVSQVNGLHKVEELLSSIHVGPPICWIGTGS